jgi:HNH endonuclease
LIPIARLALDDDLTIRLEARTSQLKLAGANAESARTLWGSARTERRKLRELLALMAPGIQRCMYCGDNLGTDIDHFAPISISPLKTFEWLNHLLACSHCNSNEKRDKYPCDAAGNALLLDPTRERPSDHLRLVLNEGRYDGLTEIGSVSIEVFGLNRPDLRQGRERAFRTRRAILYYIHKLIVEGREDEAILNMEALVEEPHASVLHAILGVMESNQAEAVLGPDIVAILRNPDMQRLVQLTWRNRVPTEDPIAGDTR